MFKPIRLLKSRLKAGAWWLKKVRFVGYCQLFGSGASELTQACIDHLCLILQLLAIRHRVERVGRL